MIQSLPAKKCLHAMPKQEDLSAVGSAGPAGSAPRVKLYSLHCQVCLKSFRTQRDFANHRRRKDFCVPPKRPAPPDGAAPPAPPKVSAIH